MGLFSVLKNVKLQRAWAHSVQGEIWRLLVTPDGEYIVGEDRDVVGKKVFFFAIELLTGRVLWSGVALDEPWWIGLEDVSDDSIFVHTYASPDLPGHKGIRALDVKTGSIRWEHQELRYVFAAGDYVYCDMGFGGSVQVVEIASATGTVLRYLTEEEVDSLSSVNSRRNPMLTLPVKGGDEKSAAVLKAQRGLESVIEADSRLEFIEWAAIRNMVIAAGYSAVSVAGGGTARAQHIVISGPENTGLRYHDVLMRHASAIVPDGFFCCGKQVLYVRERRELVSVALPDH